MVASDVDGTILASGQREIDARLLTQIRRLQARGIAFCAASGRQYQSLRRLFRALEDDIFYLCENGAIVFRHQAQGERELVAKLELAPQFCGELIRYLAAKKDCILVLSGENCSYLHEKDRSFGEVLSREMGNRVVLLPSYALDALPEAPIKAAIYCERGSAREIAVCRRDWKDRYNVAEAGNDWIDFMSANKARGLEALCRAEGFALRDVMAFGDNFNDLEMLGACGEAYLLNPKLAPFCRFPHQVIRSVADQLECLIEDLDARD